MFVFRNPAGAAVKDIGEVLLSQSVQRLINFAFRQCGHWIAIVLLIARRRQRVEGERIILRRRDLFFDQRAKDANFSFG